MKHEIATAATCPRVHAEGRVNCPTCDWGLSICLKCNKAEVELDEPCVPETEREKMVRHNPQSLVGLALVRDLVNPMVLDESGRPKVIAYAGERLTLDMLEVAYDLGINIYVDQGTLCSST